MRVAPGREQQTNKLLKEVKKLKKGSDKNKQQKESVIIKESKIHGLGLFAAKDIPNGTWVIQYVGPIVGPEEKKIMAPEDKRYLFKLRGEYSVDGRYAYRNPPQFDDTDARAYQSFVQYCEVHQPQVQRKQLRNSG